MGPVVELTCMGLIDVHFHEPEFSFTGKVDGASSHGSESGETTDGATEAEYESTSGGGSRLGPVLVLAVFVVAAVAVRRLRGNGDAESVVDRID